MRRTEALQGVRMIKLRSVLDRYEASELSQLEAAELLGMGERTFRRWRRRFEGEGEAGLVDRRPGKPACKQGRGWRAGETRGWPTGGGASRLASRFRWMRRCGWRRFIGRGFVGSRRSIFTS